MIEFVTPSGFVYTMRRRDPQTLETVSVAKSFIYAWGNNARRAELKGRRCVIEARGRMNTVLVRFLDTGERVTTSRRALR